MHKELIKGNEAVVKAAILAGCRFYFGYPITPASEIAQAAAYYMPLVKGTFLQAESEVAAINMVYGAASAGQRCMTASSGPGISLKQEGISYLAGAELPCVIVDIMRAGPGLGNIWPEQGDYNQVVKGGGHGNYKNIVLAPASAQEMCNFTFKAFELADKYRNPVFILTDGYVGQMMEPVEFPAKVEQNNDSEKVDWALLGEEKTRKNLVTSILMNTELEEQLNIKLQKKYALVEKNETMWEELYTEDADLIVISYGIVSRITFSAVEMARKKGRKIGWFRLTTLFPFPKERLKNLAEMKKSFMVIELSNGQMLDDVRLSVEGKAHIAFYNRMGGAVPDVEEIFKQFEKFFQQNMEEK